VLSTLQIRDLAVIESADLDLGTGFTALTGETGAGKSMLVDALALVTGERADARAVRAGAERLEVSAGFDIRSCEAAIRWLRDNDMDEAGECVLRRVVGSDGRSRAWINGRPVPVQTLRELGAMLVDICGQADYQSLRHRSVQRDILDGAARHEELLADVSSAHHDWRLAADEHQRLCAIAGERDARRELLGHQLAELEALALKPGEVEDLEREHRVQSHRVRIAEAISTALSLVYADDASADAAVTSAQRALQGALAFDATLEPVLQMLEDASIQVREAADQLRQRLDALDADPAREAAVADRLAAIGDLARKHRVEAGHLPEVQAGLASEAERLENFDRSLAAAQARLSSSRQRLEEAAGRLSRSRRKAASGLAGAIAAGIEALGMPDGQFEVRMEPRRYGEIGPDGADDVEFLFTANPGQPPAAMARVASGGELSRLNLAVQVAAARDAGAATLVFDEVDAGVGGAVAEIVGRQLRALSERRQVLCITHLPQVAAQAHQHATVTKTTRAGRTRTSVQVLGAKERVEETARMLGGVSITDRTRAHAREMLAAGRPVRSAS
jgi:DNA repair protein RecN (Recombination protein N)